MCVEIEIDNRVCDDVASLREALEGPLIFDPSYPESAISGDQCLCCVDVQLTANANELDVVETVDPLFVIFERGVVQ